MGRGNNDLDTPVVMISEMELQRLVAQAQAANAPKPVLPANAFKHVGHVDAPAVEKVSAAFGDASVLNQPFVQDDAQRQVVGVEPEKGPWLAAPDLDAMQKFWPKRLKYEQDMIERYRQLGGAVAIRARTIRSSMDPWTFYAISKYRWGVADPDQLDEPQIHALFEADVRGTVSQIDAFEQRVQSELKMDLTIKDGPSRIICLVTKYERICFESGLRTTLR
jgi:hypothetical protein